MAITDFRTRTIIDFGTVHFRMGWGMNFTMLDWFGVFANCSWSSSNCDHFSAPTPSSLLPAWGRPAPVQTPQFFSCRGSSQIFPPTKSHATFQPQTQSLRKANLDCPLHLNIEPLGYSLVKLMGVLAYSITQFAVIYLFLCVILFPTTL